MPTLGKRQLILKLEKEDFFARIANQFFENQWMEFLSATEPRPGFEDMSDGVPQSL